MRRSHAHSPHRRPRIAVPPPSGRHERCASVSDQSSSRRPLLFVSHPEHLDAPIPGGIQVCTQEYCRLLAAAGFELIRHPVDPSRSFWTRLRIKAGVDTYDRHDFATMLQSVLSTLKATGCAVVAINQVSLLPLGRLLKAELGDRVTVICLSHGSESGDVLHEVVREATHGAIRDRLAEWRLGRMVATESRLFMTAADVLLTLSETDDAIARWQGSERTLVVPRTWAAEPLQESWPSGVIGYLGTLHHKPNWDGLLAVLTALASLDHSGVEVRVVGGPDAVGARLAASFPSVTYVGHLPESELLEEARRWSTVINPVFWNARGASTKLAKAISWGIPIVSSRVGARGYRGITDEVIWADSPAEMARLALRLSCDAELRGRSAMRVRELAGKSPSLHELGCQLNQALASLAESECASAVPSGPKGALNK